MLEAPFVKPFVVEISSSSKIFEVRFERRFSSWFSIGILIYTNNFFWVRMVHEKIFFKVLVFKQEGNISIDIRETFERHSTCCPCGCLEFVGKTKKFYQNFNGKNISNTGHPQKHPLRPRLRHSLWMYGHSVIRTSSYTPRFKRSMKLEVQSKFQKYLENFLPNQPSNIDVYSIKEFVIRMLRKLYKESEIYNLKLYGCLFAFSAAVAVVTFF